jgi:hypothetical protein
LTAASQRRLGKIAGHFLRHAACEHERGRFVPEAADHDDT